MSHKKSKSRMNQILILTLNSTGGVYHYNNTPNCTQHKINKTRGGRDRATENKIKIYPYHSDRQIAQRLTIYCFNDTMDLCKKINGLLCCKRRKNKKDSNKIVITVSNRSPQLHSTTEKKQPSQNNSEINFILDSNNNTVIDSNRTPKLHSTTVKKQQSQKNSETNFIIDSNGNTKLHSALLAKKPESFITKLIDKHQHYYSSIKHKNKEGYYPLHYACLMHQYKNIVVKLINDFPLAAKEKTAFGDYPLHLACANYQSKKVVLNLISVFPKAAKEKNITGIYPFQ
jgi:ankyrin repeat protein